MKKILSFIFASCFFGSVLTAQTIYVTSKSYYNLKKTGQLNPTAKYKLLDEQKNEQIKAESTLKQTLELSNKSGNPSSKTSSSGSCECLVPVDPTFTIVPMTGGFSGATAPDWRNDDGYSGSIPLGFNFCFYGTTYTSCFINNNGNITFNNGLASFSAGGFPAGNATNLDTIMIAPFWGDVDTQGPGSGLVYYKKTPTALIVKWSTVGYFSAKDNLLNDFQLIITDGTDPLLPNGNNVAFCYGDMQWTTGSASQGVNGFGGIPATVGVNKGDHTNYVQIGRFNLNNSSYDGPYGLNDGISFLDNKSYFFNTCGTNNNLPPIIQDATGGGSACGDTIKICAYNDTLLYTTSFLAPENNQTISVTSSAPTLGTNFQPLGVTATSAGITTFAWRIIADVSIIGVHTVIITGKDNGTPPLSSSATYYIKIENIAIPQPTLSVLPTGSICATPGATIALTNCSSYDNVYWSNGSSGCSTIANVSGPFYVTVNKNGCYKSSADTINIYPTPVVQFQTTPIVFCNGSFATLTPTVTSGTPAFSYTWSPASLGAAATATTSTVGTYTLLVTDQNLCKAKATVSVVKSTPSVNLSSPDLIICPGECSEITAVATSSFTPFTYSWSNNAADVKDSTLMCMAGTVIVTATDNKGCVATKTINVVNDVIPVASFTATPSSPVTPGQIINFTSTSTIPSGTITTTTWVFGDGNTASGNPLSHSYTNAGTFPVTLIVTGSSGCADTTTIDYVVDALLILPNVITPNGDNTNDYLKFKNLELLGNNNIAIFNRWGKKIFEQDNYKNDWNGGSFTDGTYFFILTVPLATPTTYKGYFQIIR